MKRTDASLLLVAERNNEGLLTNDKALNRVAEARGITTLWVTTPTLKHVKEGSITKEEAKELLYKLIETRMIFLDSWVWIEFFSQDKKAEKAETIIKKLEQEKGYISTIVTMEVRYRIGCKFGEEKADQVTLAIKSFDNLEKMPITNEVGKYAADLRDKYYKRREREISYGDAINLAVAVLTDCEKLYTGDPAKRRTKKTKYLLQHP